MTKLRELTGFLDELLNLKAFPDDPSNNGLQFEGGAEVAKAVFAVDACQATFDLAADKDADFVFAHHGLSWGPGVRRATGLSANRLTALAANGISLYAAHVPLDANPEFGHNILLASMLDLQEIRPFGLYHGQSIGFAGFLPKPRSIAGIAKIMDEKLPSSGGFRAIGESEQTQAHSVAVISGGGAWPELFEDMSGFRPDLLITGEAGHEVFHPAMEAGVSILTLGHYRSETPGVLAVMRIVGEKFGIRTEFIDLPTGL